MREDNHATNRFFEEPLATSLHNKRMKARQKGRRLVYDCRNNQVIPGDRIRCKHKHALGIAGDGTLSLVQVLQGITPSVCKGCGDYWGWEGENEAGE